VGEVLPSSYEPRVVVLCYHSIHRTSPASCASPELFDEHLQWLSSECECIPFSRIPERIAAPSHGKPTVAVTFDDGYADNHGSALPLLVKWGIPATFFLTAGLLERDPAVIDRFRFLLRCSDDEFQPLTWPQVQEMREAGMEIGAHTYRHPNLALLSPSQIRTELELSIQVLGDRLGLEVTTMAYPFGKPRRHVTPDVVKATEELGFRLAASILHRGVRRTDHPLQIPRFTVLHDSVDTLRARVSGAFDLVGMGQERGPIWAAKLITPQDFTFGT
jgi:peptidoglycan/xylan/chitin deacetylase (PgdA/CDA1 family)